MCTTPPMRYVTFSRVRYEISVDEYATISPKRCAVTDSCDGCWIAVVFLKSLFSCSKLGEACCMRQPRGQALSLFERCMRRRHAVGSHRCCLQIVMLTLQATWVN
ncbi:hypothetical protein AB1Y20_002669 [Prymnesium parvum]|uniref:Uncharacterized protein n=1 Tax=Prymnesium parvum TaxID=97485 RepID=A0AB34J9Q9_PRYPA